MTEAAGFPGHAMVPPRALWRRYRHKKCAPTDSARSLPAVLCVPPNARRHVCGLFTAHAASRPTRVKGGRRTRLAAQDRPTPEGVGGKGLAPTHGASTQSTRQHATTPHRGRERGREDNNNKGFPTIRLHFAEDKSGRYAETGFLGAPVA